MGLTRALLTKGTSRPPLRAGRLFARLTLVRVCRYRIVKNVLSPDECTRLENALLEETCDIVFRSRGYHDVNPHDPDFLQLFTDKKTRVAKLGDATATFRHGNPRTPLLSKNCGMIDIHFNPVCLELIATNPSLHKVAALMYGQNELVHRGTERVCIKGPGSTDMLKHLDANPFYPEVNYPVRLQSLVCVNVDTQIDPRQSGTLCVLANFHHYWDFFGALCHPKTGLEDDRFPDDKSRYFILPTGRNGWDNHWLPLFRKHITAYTAFFHDGKQPSDPDLRNMFPQLKAQNISVPYTVKALRWTPIELEAGDMVFWHQHLPHYSVRNESQIPRVACYYSTFPVAPGWFGSEQQKWAAKQITKGHFYYDGQEVVKNPEEVQYLADHPEVMEQIRTLCSRNEFTRKLLAGADWYAAAAITTAAAAANDD